MRIADRSSPVFITLVLATTVACVGSIEPHSGQGRDGGADQAADSGPDGNPPLIDPGSDPWDPVPENRVAEECGLEPALLRAADQELDEAYAVVRYGKLCHEYYPQGAAGAAAVDHVFSTTKTLGALVTGMVAWQTRDIPHSGRKTGPLSDQDRVDHWLDEFDFNPEAHLAHVLAMVAHNADLSFGAKTHTYDTTGSVQINRLSDVLNTAIAQDSDRLGGNLEQFVQRFLYQPLGMRDSTWSDGRPDKVFAYSWNTTVRDMARVGLLMLNGGSWSGERLLSEECIRRMTHPSFEDANTGYGYLTWLSSDSNYTFGGLLGGSKRQGAADPPALHVGYPHGLSGAPDCLYEPPYDCEQRLDVGVWYASGMGGQFIVGHSALDLVLVIKDFGVKRPPELWRIVRPALVALDETFAGDEESFCAAYADGSYEARE